MSMLRDTAYTEFTVATDSTLVIDDSVTGSPSCGRIYIHDRPDEVVSFGQYFTQNASVETRFRRLVARWKRETMHLSSITEISMNPAYQEILGLGRAALPLIIDELRREPDHWMWALRAITGKNPVSSASQGNMSAMANAWLRWWAKQNN